MNYEIPWFVYLIECRDKKLYVGVSKDVKKRVEEHNRGVACRFTKYRCPVKLLGVERFSDYKSARQRESELKGFSRIKKLQAIKCKIN